MPKAGGLRTGAGGGRMAVQRYHRDKDFFKEHALPTQGFPLPTGSQAVGPVMPRHRLSAPKYLKVKTGQLGHKG